ncbi:MAG: sigma-70 family RNA polymerase sigma factor [Bacteroidota bacterium]
MLKVLKSQDQKSDEELVRQFQQSGDRFLLGLLLRRYSQSILGTCHYYLRQPQDAEDAAMEVCELIVRQLQKPKEIKRFKDWVFIIARNYCFRKLKDNKRLTELSTEWEKDFLNSDVQYELGDTLYVQEEALYARVDAEIQQLNEQQRLCLTAFYWQGEKYKDIAARYGMTTDEVRSAIQNGRRNLRNRFKGDG